MATTVFDMARRMAMHDAHDAGTEMNMQLEESRGAQEAYDDKVQQYYSTTMRDEEKPQSDLVRRLSSFHF